MTTSSQQQQQQQPTSLDLTRYLSSLITMTKSTSLVAIYHVDIPVPPPSSSPITNIETYKPTSLSLLTYLCTTVMTLHPLPMILSTRHAQSRSLEAPRYGLDEGKGGVVVGLKPARWTRHLEKGKGGCVIELEHRRKSGRGVREWFFLPVQSTGSSTVDGGKEETTTTVSLLDDHPLLRVLDQTSSMGGEGEEGNKENELSGMTFELGLTDRQRLERDGVVLPYFDAQRVDAGGGAEGGRILYDMGVEDDFDEEEDEI